MLLLELPAAVRRPLARIAACWGLAAAGGNGAASLAVWAELLAAGTAFCPDVRKLPGLRAALALLLAGLYMLLTFTPPGWGPFVNPLG